MKNKFIYFVLSVLALSFGAIIYILFREETFITEILLKIGIHISSPMLEIEGNFIKYYLPDFLWGISLCSAFYMVFDKPDEKYVPFYTTCFLGLLWEILQKLNIVHGTGDFLDLLMYITAALTVVLINKIVRRICNE